MRRLIGAIGDAVDIIIDIGGALVIPIIILMVIASVVAGTFGINPDEINLKGLLPTIWSSIVAVWNFFWNIAIYLAVAYLIIENFRMNHNLKILRRIVEKLEGKNIREF